MDRREPEEPFLYYFLFQLLRGYLGHSSKAGLFGLWLELQNIIKSCNAVYIRDLVYISGTKIQCCIMGSAEPYALCVTYLWEYWAFVVCLLFNINDSHKKALAWNNALLEYSWSCGPEPYQYHHPSLYQPCIPWPPSHQIIVAIFMSVNPCVKFGHIYNAPPKKFLTQ